MKKIGGEVAAISQKQQVLPIDVRSEQLGRRNFSNPDFDMEGGKAESTKKISKKE